MDLVVNFDMNELTIKGVKEAMRVGISLISCSKGSTHTWNYSFNLKEISSNNPHGLNVEKMDRGIVISLGFGEATPYVSFDKSDYPPWPEYEQMAIVLQEDPGQKHLDISIDPAIVRYEHIYLTDDQAIDILYRIQQEGWDCLSSFSFAPASYLTDEHVETMKALEAAGQVDLKGRFS